MSEYCFISLTQGQFAKVSPEDFARLSAFKWHAWWSKDTQSFYAIRHGRKGEPTKVGMHRQVAGVTDPKVDVDHINRDTLDNQRSNLRACSRRQNSTNQVVRRNNKIGLKGVNELPSGRFRAQIMCDGKRHRIGTFDTPEQAHMAYREAATRLHGQFSPQRLEA